MNCNSIQNNFFPIQLQFQLHCLKHCLQQSRKAASLQRQLCCRAGSWQGYGSAGSVKAFQLLQNFSLTSTIRRYSFPNKKKNKTGADTQFIQCSYQQIFILHILPKPQDCIKSEVFFFFNQNAMQLSFKTTAHLNSPIPTINLMAKINRKTNDKYLYIF